MSKFKVGDRIKYTSNRHSDHESNPLWGGCCGYVIGSIYEITALVTCPIKVNWDNNLSNSYYETDLELVEEKPTKKTIMSNLITTFKNITRTEPNKTFVKAGVMNEDLTLTSEGTELFIQFMFDKHATEFKTEVVDAILAEQEKK